MVSKYNKKNTSLPCPSWHRLEGIPFLKRRKREDHATRRFSLLAALKRRDQRDEEEPSLPCRKLTRRGAENPLCRIVKVVNCNVSVINKWKRRSIPCTICPIAHCPLPIAHCPLPCPSLAMFRCICRVFDAMLDLCEGGCLVVVLRLIWRKSMEVECQTTRRMCSLRIALITKSII
jgi:hypothetical protein